jgi:hypothetical protein
MEDDFSNIDTVYTEIETKKNGTIHSTFGKKI